MNKEAEKFPCLSLYMPLPPGCSNHNPQPTQCRLPILAFGYLDACVVWLGVDCTVLLTESNQSDRDRLPATTLCEWDICLMRAKQRDKTIDQHRHHTHLAAQNQQDRKATASRTAHPSISPNVPVPSSGTLIQLATFLEQNQSCHTNAFQHPLPTSAIASTYPPPCASSSSPFQPADAHPHPYFPISNGVFRR